jgi:hypothetical protein
MSVMAGWKTVAVVVLFATARAWGQYTEESRPYQPATSRYAGVGVFARDFAPSPGNAAADSLTIRYARAMPFLFFRQGPVDLTFGYAAYDLPQRSSRSSLFIGMTFTSEWPLAGSRGSALVLPVLLAGDFTKSQSAGAEKDDFNVASLGIGAGLKARFGGETADLSLMLAGVMHYSFSGYSVQTGSSSALLGEIAAVFPGVPIGEGIAVGYRLRLQRWNVGSDFDYKTTNHGLSLGVLF